MPCTPMPESASRTSSSLNGLMIAVTSFIRVSVGKAPLLAAPSVLALERLADGKDDRALAGVLGRRGARERVAKAVHAWIRRVAASLGVAADQRGAEQPAAQVLRDAELVVGVVAPADVRAGAPAFQLEPAQVPDQTPAATHVVIGREIPVVSVLRARQREVVGDGVVDLEREPFPGAADVHLVV